MVRTTCKRCAAPIAFVRTSAGRSLPIDPEPSADGTLIVEGKRARSVRAEDPPGPRYRAHLSYCVVTEERRP